MSKILAWALQLLVAVAFLGAGGAKLFGAALTVLHNSPAGPIVLLILCAVVVWLRWPAAGTRTFHAASRA
jgi:hypothetical protein